METIQLVIPNYHNKLASDCIVHVFKTKGKRYTWEYTDLCECHIEETEGTWLIKDIGEMKAEELPSWIYFISHGLTREEYIKVNNIKPDAKVYWFIFIKKPTV